MRCLSFQGPISRSSIEGLMIGLQRADAPSSVFVSSGGGQFEFFSILGPAIERMGITTVAGKVQSAAVILFLLGHTRYARPGATFFFHEVRTVVMGQTVTLCDLERAEEIEQRLAAETRDALQEIRRRNKQAQSWFAHFVAERLHISPGILLNLMRAKATLDVREAMKYGLVHATLEQPLTLV